MTDKTVEVATVSQHTVVSASTTATTTQHGDAARKANCFCDVSYLRSLQGLTKMAEILLSLVAFIVMVSSLRNPGLNFFLFVAIAATVVSTITLVLLSTHLHQKVPIPWNIVFAVVYAVMAILYFVAFVIAAADSYLASHGAAVTLGFFAVIAYIGSVYFAVQDWRLNQQMTQQAQGATATYTGQMAENPPAYDTSY